MESTGFKGLDDILTGLRAGDNVVWQIDGIDDYKAFVERFVKKALEKGKKVIYMRFAQHEALLQPGKGIREYKLDAGGGFESFTTAVNNIITEEGIGAYYVFDCLSSLLPAWATDLMVGNFFMVTCPYLFELDTIAYFSIMRNRHSFRTVARIRETTQLLIDVYRCEGKYYVHPIKVWNRYSPTMFLPHLVQGDKFRPVTDSVNAAEILSHISRKGAGKAKRNLDYWDRLFLEAEEMAASSVPKPKKMEMVQKLCGIMMTKNKKMLSLVTKKFDLKDLVGIKARLVGTGYVGGKTVGMLLARKMLKADKDLAWKKISEPHDSFYVGSDVFYTYIVQNGWWKLRMEQKTDEGYFETARVMREKMLHGKFPEEVMEQFQEVIEYFGTSPFIVRSSSLLEDGFGNAFAGKYESVFCPNQGTPEQRYLQFAEAVRHIYSSALSEDALAYRQKRGLDKMDEQMALLVQRVSGSYHRDYFFPDIGGVGVSRNVYVWTKEMDPRSGMLRIVFGLGTRAVNRVEDDYPRIVALDSPLLRPQAEMQEVKRFSQHNVDLIDVKENAFRTVPFDDLAGKNLDTDLDWLVTEDEEAERTMKDLGKEGGKYWILTFDKLLSEGPFCGMIKKILKTLEEAYQYPVEIEFTLNFTEDGGFRINLLQCRPLQTMGLGEKVDIPANIRKDKTLFRMEGHFLGGNVSQPIHRVIYVDPARYVELTITEKYDIARIIGNLNRQIGTRTAMPVLLLGPGRWGTTMPSMGVPVKFAEINNVSVLGEIAFEGGNLMPELSFGTHFFQDLVETSMFYVAVFPKEKGVIFSSDWLFSHDNLFERMLPESAKYKYVIGVYDVVDDGLRVMSDIVSQKVVCFAK